MNEAVVLSPWDRVRDHWGARAWLRTFHVAAGTPVAMATAGALVVLGAVGIVFIWTVLVPLLALTLIFLLVPLFSRWQRARFIAFLDVEIEPLPRRGARRSVPAWFYGTLRAASMWRQVAYHLLAPLFGLLGLTLVLGAWAGGAVAMTVAVKAGDEMGVPAQVAFVALSAALFTAAPWTAQVVTALDVTLARALLGPSRNELLAARVATLSESRAEVVDAADAERRRIERDLHDGTQQRLVSLAMKLGMARAVFADLPEPARDVIVQAHEEAKLALKELRDFVRGLHPAVLNDQGLDPALSGLAAGAPFPVRLRVEMAERATPTIEAVAFFVVSEALTNIAKHAEASGADVVLTRDGDVIRLLVRDDGRGGADPARGSGLRGLSQRVGSVDGTLRIDSPPGGPTTIEVELPCE
ncbi:Signal transduction histidine kinase [Sinosporangium album]|uniref:histidine kinase n=1 Tax=Sinosporangium album TaxID=504805 RepID=A0A1G7W6E8_9ACTN|nr:sensor histidine kinase [Sinosporangium album]SDG67523.1 Signal transduction histidine kinase [Sinosporangium album]